MRQKGLSVIFLLLGIGLILGVAAGGYLFGRSSNIGQPQNSVITSSSPNTTPTPSPSSISNLTDDWQTYDNTQFGFTFKYPQMWVLVDNVSGNASGMLSVHQLNIFNPTREKDALPNITIEISKDNLPEYTSPKTPTTDMIDGIKTDRQSIPSDMQSAIEAEFFKKGVNNYRITLMYADQKQPEGKETYNQAALTIFNQILSTFKFTDLPQPSKTPVVCTVPNIPYFNQCSCSWKCVDKIPEFDCTQACLE